MKKKTLSFFVAPLVFFLFLTNIHAASYGEIQSVVQQSETIINTFHQENQYPGLREQLSSAKAVFVIPQQLKGGFFIGGSGGSGALISRDMRSGQWGYPVFYSMGSISFGFQIGAKASEILLLVMTEKGMDSLLTNSFKLGADVSVAAGPIGAGVKAATADILAYMKSKGAFGGVAIEGAVVRVKNDWNATYYGTQVTPADIVIRKTHTNPDADGLRGTLDKIAKPTVQKVKY